MVCCCPQCLLADLWMVSSKRLRSNTAFAEGSCPDHCHAMACCLARQLPEPTGALWGAGSWAGLCLLFVKTRLAPFPFAPEERWQHISWLSFLKDFCSHQDFPAAVATWHKAGPLASPGSSALHVQFYLETNSFSPSE